MFPRTFASSVCALALTFTLVGLAQAEVYKCTIDGHATFSDKPCPSGEKSQVLEDKKVQTVPALKIPTLTATPTPTPTGSSPAASVPNAAHQAASPSTAATPAAEPPGERRCFKNKNGRTFCNSNAVQ